MAWICSRPFFVCRQRREKERAVKKPIRFIVAFVVAVVVIAGLNRAVQWFLNSSKDVAMERTQKAAPSNELPKKN
jgi:flagellar basal body-associated protein FliL